MPKFQHRTDVLENTIFDNSDTIEEGFNARTFDWHATSKLERKGSENDAQAVKEAFPQHGGEVVSSGR